MTDLAEDWAALNHPRRPECVVCGVGGDIQLGSVPEVTWRCFVCRGYVCPTHTLCMPDARDPRPHHGGREYFEQTLCSVECWERAGKPDE